MWSGFDYHAEPRMSRQDFVDHAGAAAASQNRLDWTKKLRFNVRSGCKTPFDRFRLK